MLAGGGVQKKLVTERPGAGEDVEKLALEEQRLILKVKGLDGELLYNEALDGFVRKQL